MDARAIIKRLGGYKVPAHSEAVLQDGFAALFPLARREVYLKAADGQSLGRIDFMIGRIGIECKVGRVSPVATAAQLDRYALSPEVDELILLTSRKLSLTIKSPKRLTIYWSATSWL